MGENAIGDRAAHIVVVGSRGSKLALAQTNGVIATLQRAHPELDVRLATVRTEGDLLHSASLAQIGGTGVFVKEIEAALQDEKADLAVHSLKDMPAELPAGLMLAAIPKREDPRDVFIGRNGLKFDDLPAKARLGTSSLRRQAQLLALKPSLEIIPLRGNVETRLRKMNEEKLDGVVLAAAGLKRLGLGDQGGEILPVEIMLPAVGQGALALEARQDDITTRGLAEQMTDPDTLAAVTAERAFLARLQGGCQVPIAGFAWMEGGKVVLKALVADLDGRRAVRGQGRADRQQAAALGRQVAEEVLVKGGRAILAELYGEAPA